MSEILAEDFMSVVIPAFNEEENIRRIPSELLPILDGMGIGYEVIIIDDGSRDSTSEEVDKISKLHKGVRLVRHEENMGLAEATRTGIKHARGNITVFLDADFTFHPQDIPKLYAKYRETHCDCVVGSHFISKGSTEVELHRLILSRTLNFLYSLLLGKKVSTISSIFRLYKTEALKKLNLTSKGFSICAEILVNMLRDARHIEEVPVKLTTRIYGNSKINARKEFMNHMRMLLRIFAWNVKRLFS